MSYKPSVLGYPYIYMEALILLCKNIPVGIGKSPVKWCIFRRHVRLPEGRGFHGEGLGMNMDLYIYNIIYWLVVWLPFFVFPYIGFLIIPIDSYFSEG